jgi:poly-gamma-glutamate synthesis protein (capsule biosynthesis protein)
MVIKLKIMIQYFLYIAFSFITFINCNNIETNRGAALNQDSIKKQDSLKKIPEQDTIWISAAGDLMCHGAQLSDARRTNGYDFSHMFDVIAPIVDWANLTFGNFETVTAGADKNFTGYPTFNTPDDFAFSIKKAGFDVLTTANNHCLDRGFAGIQRTIEVLNECGAMQTGTAASEEHSNEVLVINEKGVRIAVLAYTFGTNGINPPSGKEYCVNYINLQKMKEDVSAAKNLGVDKIVVCIHWGTEYERNPNSGQKKVADELFDMGVDIIFGSHPHVIQPMETRTITDEKGNPKKVFIIYSMGNFISNQRKRYTDSGVIVSLQLIKNNKTGITIINTIDYTPTYVSTAGNSFKVIPVRESIYAVKNNLTNSRYYFPGDYSRLLEVWDETTSHLTNETYDIYPSGLMMDE